MSHSFDIKLTKSQLLKIIHDAPITVSHKHLGHGRHVIHLSSKNANKVMKAYNNQGQTKILLDDEEKMKTLEGNGIGHFFKKSW
jgi:hypothetical protein